MSCQEEKCMQTKANLKQLKKFYKIDQAEMGKLKEELQEIKIQLQTKDEEMGKLQSKNAQSEKRIAQLQAEVEAQKNAGKGGGWGFQFPGGGGNQELAKLKEDLEVMEEQFQAKLEENQQVHEKNFELKREMNAIQDDLQQKEMEHTGVVRNLNSDIAERVEQIEKLTAELTASQEKNVKLDETKKDLQKQYESDKNSWQDERTRFEKEIDEKQVRHEQRVPFDPHDATEHRIFNVIKSNGKTRQKQVEIVQALAKIVDPNSNSSIGQAFLLLLKSLRDQLDGSIPVFNEFGEADPSETESTNPGVRKFPIYIERIIEMIGKLDESVPEFFMQLFMTLESLISVECGNEPGSAGEKSPTKKLLKKADVGHSLGNLVHYFNQFQDFFCNFMDEQVAAARSEAGTKQRAQADAQTLKSVNDMICRSIQNIKMVLHSLRDTFESLADQNATSHSSLLQQVCEDILKLKSELQGIATHSKKKINLFKENRSLLSYESKSNSLSLLRDETLSSLHNLVNSIDHVQQALVQAKSLFTTQIEQKTVLNNQLPGQNSKIEMASNLMASLNKGLQGTLKGIPYDEQVAITKKLEANEKQVQVCQTQLNSIKKESFLLKEQKKQSELQTAKFQAMVQILKTKLKDKYETSTQVSGNTAATVTTFDPTSIRNEVINPETPAEQSAQPPLLQMDHVKPLLEQESQKDFYLFGDVFSGLQKYAIQVKKSDDNQQVPLNDFVSKTARQRLLLLQEKSLQKLCQMSQKMQSVNKLSQGSSLQVMEKDREWKEKLDKVECQHEDAMAELNKKLRAAEADKDVITKNFQAQINMLSEHMASLSEENEKLKNQ